VKTKSNKLAEIETVVIERKLETARLEFNSGEIEFANSKGTTRSLAYARVDKNGGFVGDRQVDTAAWDDFVAMSFKAQHEQKRSLNNGARLAVKAGHSIKMGTASCNFRTSKMTAAKADVCVQLAHAQKLAREIDSLQAELDRRSEMQRLKADEAKAQAQQADILASLVGTAKAA
jgi:hypothetical protein